MPEIQENTVSDDIGKVNKNKGPVKGDIPISLYKFGVDKRLFEGKAFLLTEQKVSFVKVLCIYIHIHVYIHLNNVKIYFKCSTVKNVK